MTVFAMAAWLEVACTSEKPARSEVVLHVDVDMPTTGQLGVDISNDAAVDTLRIDVFTTDKKLVDSRTFSVANQESLPLSFGIPASIASDGKALVRLRAFRAAYATAGQQNGLPVLDPLAPVTVDRLATLLFPANGVGDESIVLHGECFGVPVRFGLGGEEGHTCIDATQADATSSSGLLSKTTEATLAGSFRRAAVRPCAGSAPPGSLCIPGGLSILGDPLYLARNELEIDATPVKLVDHAPYFLDAHEVTVGELRALVIHGYAGPLPTPRAASAKDCSWDPAAPDGLPVNCITVEVGESVCAARGGRLPSEAQWEHAARGRGERRLFAWGNGEPECCTASIARVSTGGCSPVGLESIGSHQGDGTCAADVTRDGVLDMTGSVAELVRDTAAKFDQPCWKPTGPLAILDDPVCATGALGRMARGAAWGFALGDAALSIRRTFSESDPNYGFRCAYEDSP